MNNLDERRVVSVSWEDGAGSGYLLTPGLLLTVSHCVGAVGSKATVMALAPEPGSGAAGLTDRTEFTVVATTTGTPGGKAASPDGFALLQSEKPDPFSLGDLGDVRWGRVAGHSPLAAEMIGFPRLADTEGWLNIEHAIGEVIPLSGTRRVPAESGPAWSLAFHVQSGTPAVRVGEGELWQGASGAALFSEGHLVGVLSEYQPTLGGRLKAIPASLLLEQPDVRQVLEERTRKPLVIEPIWPGRDVLEPAYTALPGVWSAADLLRARHNVVPFSGRQQELRMLEEWCRDPRDVSVVLMRGRGALGKTRLARELCERMSREGWVAGLLTPLAGDVTQLMELDEDRLIVIDDADVRVGQLDAVLRNRGGRRRLRVLAIARQLGSWSHGIQRRYDPLVQPALDLTPPEPAARNRVYRDAWMAFHDREEKRLAGEDGRRQEESKPVLAPRSAASADLADKDFESYLFILIVALIDVRRALGEPGAQPGAARSVTRSEALYDQALDLEREDWIKGAEQAGLPTDPVLLDRVVAVASLAYADGDTDGHGESTAARRLLLVPDLSDATELTRRKFVRMLQERTDGYGALRPLRPQRLAEHLTAKTIRSFPELAAQMLSASRDPAEEPADAAQQALNTLQLLSIATFGEQRPQRPHTQFRDKALYRALHGALRAHGADLIALVGSVLDTAADATGKSLASTLETVFRGLPPDHVMADAAAKLDEDCPDALLALAATLQQGAAAYYAGQPHNALTRARLGETYKRLSRVLADSGRRRSAHDYAWQAVEHFMALVRADDSYQHRLGEAHALTNLAVRNCDVGQFAESLEPARDAVKLYEELRREKPDRIHHVHLSFALCNLSESLSYAGRWREALQAAADACDLVGHELPADPDDVSAQQTDVVSAQALAHRTLARRLPDAGRPAGEAINSALRACQLYRQLMHGKPGRWRRDYARSLDVLGRRYADNGKWARSIKTLREAQKIYEELEQEYQEAERVWHVDALRDLAGSYLGKAREHGPKYGRELLRGLDVVNAALTQYKTLSSEDAYTRRASNAVTLRIKAELELEAGKLSSAERSELGIEPRICISARRDAGEAATILSDRVANQTWKGRCNLGRIRVVYGDALAACGNAKASLRQYCLASHLFRALDEEEPGRIADERRAVLAKIGVRGCPGGNAPPAVAYPGASVPVDDRQQD